MALAVIGAGLGRTGTMSLKLALEQLGFGPCYHMLEVLQNPAFAEHWVRANAGLPMDWDAVFQGYRSAVDWPSCDYWRELAVHAPQAKVVLTVREPQGWFTSTQNTIFSPLNTFMADDPSPVGQMMRAIATRHFGGPPNDRDRCIAGFERHNAAVRQGAPAGRLLVFDVAEGWAPLCGFLGCAVPDAPFPAVNSTGEFRQHAAEMMARRPGAR
ncbi:MAG TPA: sulfotransferase [Acetobacteraceae bacterium]|nr:sulfotransferase [Acetobacteraceae bacterium]